MGTDIHGWVEVYHDPFIQNGWGRCIDIENIVGRNYDMFGMLFGVRNFANWEPLADSRGFPSFVDRTIEKSLTGYDNITYLWFHEIEAINWDEQSQNLNQRISEFDLNGNPTGMAFLDSSILSFTEREILRSGIPLKLNDVILKCVRKIRKECLSGDWELLFKLMRTLNERYQAVNTDITNGDPMDKYYMHPSYCRLIVGFDS